MSRNVKSYVFFSLKDHKEENSRTGLISHMFFEGKWFLYCFYVKEKAVILLKLHKGYLGLLQLLYDLVCKVEEGDLFEVSAYLREVSEGQFEQTVCIDNFLYQRPS